MKKIIVSAVAIGMLLSNVAFASTITSNASSSENKVVATIQASGSINLNSTDPH